MKIFDLIFAARPMLLLPVWSIYLISYEISSKSNHVSINDFIALIGISLIVAGTYYLNQLFDYESDLINNKLLFLQKNIITKSRMMATYLSVTIVGLTLGLYLGWQTCLFYLGGGLLGYFYSAPPFRFKDRPISGLLSNAVAYGLIIPLFVVWQPGALDLLPYLAPYFILVVTSGYLLTIVPDRDGDRQTGKETLAYYFNNRILTLFGIICLILSLYPAYNLNNPYLCIISAISIILFVTSLIWKNNEIIMFACKFPILLISLLAAYYFPVYLIFIIVLLFSCRLYYKKRFGIVYPKLK